MATWAAKGSIKMVLGLAVGLLIGHQVAIAGGMSSNGGEIITYQDNPWFIGAKPVTYCIQKSDAYSTPLVAALFEINYALNDWLETLKALSVSRELTLKFDYSAVCDDSVELTILLGVMTPDVEESLKLAGNGFAAYAKRTDFDLKTGRSKGYVWIAPDQGKNSYKGVDRPVWLNHSVTYLLTLHELGHVFGIDHGIGRVMERTFSEEQADRAVENRSIDKEENIYKLPPQHRLNFTRDIQVRNFDSTEVRACNSSLDIRGLPVALEILNRDGLPPEAVLCFETKKSPDWPRTEWYLRLYDRHPIAHEARLLQSVTLRGADQLGAAWSDHTSLINGKYVSKEGYWHWREFAGISSPKTEHYVVGSQGRLFYTAEFVGTSRIELHFAHRGHITKLYFGLGVLDFQSLVE